MAGIPTVEHIRHLYVMQTRAKSKGAGTRARNELERITREMQNTANSRLKRLRASDYAYGTTYDTTSEYLEQRGLKYFRETSEMRKGKTAPLTKTSYEYALRLNAFLQSKETTISGQKAIERKRFDTFRENPNFEFAREMDDGQLRNFLRFLGNSGADEYLDYFGEGSGDQLEELAYEYNRASDTQKQKMESLFEEFKRFNKYAKEVEEGKRADFPTESGLSYSELRKELDGLYEEIAKRKR